MPSPTRIPLSTLDLPQSLRAQGNSYPELKAAAISAAVAQHGKGSGIVVGRVEGDVVVLERHEEIDDAVNWLVPLLRAGRMREAMPQLEAMSRRADATASVFYNLGVALLEQNQWQEAIMRLKRAVQVEPTHAGAWLGIGNAYMQLAQPDTALQMFRKAVSLDEGSALAHRNLGNVLVATGAAAEGLPLLQRAMALSPQDPVCWFSLAKGLHAVGGVDNLAQADLLFKQFIEAQPDHPLAEEARTIRTEYAQQGVKAQGLGGFRPDVMMYILGALEDFATKSPQYRHRVAVEIAVLGRTGLDVHSSDKKYRLTTKPGAFSGLELLATMYTAFRQIDPTLPTGADFSAEYAHALALHSARSKPSPSGAG